MVFLLMTAVVAICARASLDCFRKPGGVEIPAKLATEIDEGSGTAYAVARELIAQYENASMANIIYFKTRRPGLVELLQHGREPLSRARGKLVGKVPLER